MATNAGVALEDDVTAFVDGQTVVLVVDRATVTTRYQNMGSSGRTIQCIPVLYNKVCGATVEAVSVVTGSLSATLRV